MKKKAAKKAASKKTADAKHDEADQLTQRDAFVRAAIAKSMAELGGESIDVVAARQGRRAAPQRAALEQQSLTLVRDEDKILRWRLGPPQPPSPGMEVLMRRRAGLRRAPLLANPSLSQTLFEHLEASKVGEWLKAADQKLTRPAWNERGQLWGLRKFKADGKLAPMSLDDLAKLKGKKVLIWVHGTFSNNDKTLEDIASAPGGPAMLSAAIKAYDFVLCFDHPTLSQSPVLNAFDLASRLAHGVPASVDLIAHSRGGLVVRWFCEAMRQPQLNCRAVLVGAPLAGTSLASPARAKAAMDFLANVGDAVSTVTAMGGGIFLSLASTLASLFSRVTGALATPLADAIIALVPGFAAQAREGGNVDLRALRINTGTFDFTSADSPIQYSVIRSNFQPVESGVWGFLRSFVTRPGASALDTAADFLFPGDNDLVVDVESMDQTGELDGAPLLIGNIAHDFTTSRTVHHCNYFTQRETVAAIRRTLAL